MRMARKKSIYLRKYIEEEEEKKNPTLIIMLIGTENCSYKKLTNQI